MTKPFSRVSIVDFEQVNVSWVKAHYELIQKQKIKSFIHKVHLFWNHTDEESLQLRIRGTLKLPSMILF